jgi:hypothetical protein
LTDKRKLELMMNVEEKELEQTLGAAQADEENEHSVEWLNDFSQRTERAAALKLTAEAEAKEEEEDEYSEGWIISFSQGAEEKEVVALKLAATKTKKEDKIITPWEMELEMLED